MGGVASLLPAPGRYVLVALGSLRCWSYRRFRCRLRHRSALAVIDNAAVAVRVGGVGGCRAEVWDLRRRRRRRCNILGHRRHRRRDICGHRRCRVGVRGVGVRGVRGGSGGGS